MSTTIIVFRLKMINVVIRDISCKYLVRKLSIYSYVGSVNFLLDKYTMFIFSYSRIKANSNQEPFQYRKFVKNIGVRVRF